VLSRWFDESIQWVLLDFQASVEANSVVEYRVENRVDAERAIPPCSVSIQQASSSIRIDTGVATFLLNKEILRPFDAVEIHGVSLLEKNGSRVVLTDTEGSEYEPKISDVTVEVQGPLRATLKVMGKMCNGTTTLVNFISRLTFYAECNFVKLSFTLHNSRAARHPGGLWDLGNEGSIYFKDLSFHTTLDGAFPIATRWNTQPNEPLTQQDCQKLEIYQDSSGGPNWKCHNHANRFGEVMHTFQGFRVRVDEVTVREGKRAIPVIRIESEGKCIAGVIESFWQNFPKALEVHGNRFSLRLFPHHYRDVYELQGGEQKTHTLFLQFSLAPDDMTEMGWIHHRLLPRSTPEWYAQSKATSYLIPRNQDQNKAYLMLIDSAVKGDQTFFDRREIIDEYGWRHFGELYADHEAVGHVGDRPLVSHYNNQYDVIYGGLVEYLRSGNPSWFFLMRDLARHVIDIDIYHTQEDRLQYNGGLFWHTDHYTDAGTATHRAYSKMNLGTRSFHLYGGGPSNEHNYTTGLLTYFFLTGDLAAYEAVKGLADWVVNMDDGSKMKFSFFDRRPTGWASCTVSRNHHGPGRGAGNSINALLDGYRLTRKTHYLEKAEELIRRCIHPTENIGEKNLDDVEYRWSYTVFLQVLGKYLDLKVEKNEIDYMYGYSRASLLHYAEWMVKHETPFKQVLDRVQIPTETWPAQDIRKSNVFMFAAKHSIGPLRDVFLEKAEFFFRASVNDLLSFPTCKLTRPIVLLLVNGFMRTYFQNNQSESAPEPTRKYEFGQPQSFTPQFSELYKVKGLGLAGLEAIKKFSSKVPGIPRTE